MNFKTFYISNQHIDYQEILSDDPLFEKFYLIKNPNRESIVAIPDGCVDVQFVSKKDDCRDYICGSFLQEKRSQVSNSTVIRHAVCFPERTRAALIHYPPNSEFPLLRIPLLWRMLLSD